MFYYALVKTIDKPIWINHSEQGWTKMKTKQELGCVNYKKRIFLQFLSYLSIY